MAPWQSANADYSPFRPRTLQTGSDVVQRLDGRLGFHVGTPESQDGRTGLCRTLRGTRSSKNSVNWRRDGGTVSEIRSAFLGHQFWVSGIGRCIRITDGIAVWHHGYLVDCLALVVCKRARWLTTVRAVNLRSLAVAR